MKQFKTIDEQYEYLKENKRVIASESDYSLLLERNYISLINPYKILFASGAITDDNNIKQHIYDQDISIEEYARIAKIDDEFSKILYEYIGYFERKLKCVLFYNFSKLYANGKAINEENESVEYDTACVTYAEEIKNFIDSGCDKELIPLFCPHFFETLSKKGYAANPFREEVLTPPTSSEEDEEIEKARIIYAPRIALLKNIYNSATGTNYYSDVPKGKSNSLLKHYTQKDEIVPLWVIPVCLSFGELQKLFAITSREIQQIVYASFIQVDNVQSITVKQLLNFSGYLEVMRLLRNTVNHYEPLLPFLVTQFHTAKKNKPNRLTKTLELLECNKNNSLVYSAQPLDGYINKNEYNEKEVKVLQYMLGEIKKCQVSYEPD